MLFRSGQAAGLGRQEGREEEGLALLLPCCLLILQGQARCEDCESHRVSLGCSGSAGV